MPSRWCYLPLLSYISSKEHERIQLFLQYKEDNVNNFNPFIMNLELRDRKDLL